MQGLEGHGKEHEITMRAEGALKGFKQRDKMQRGLQEID